MTTKLPAAALLAITVACGGAPGTDAQKPRSSAQELPDAPVIVKMYRFLVSDVVSIPDGTVPDRAGAAAETMLDADYLARPELRLSAGAKVGWPFGGHVSFNPESNANVTFSFKPHPTGGWQAAYVAFDITTTRDQEVSLSAESKYAFKIFVNSKGRATAGAGGSTGCKLELTRGTHTVLVKTLHHPATSDAPWTLKLSYSPEFSNAFTITPGGD